MHLRESRLIWRCAQERHLDPALRPAHLVRCEWLGLEDGTKVTGFAQERRSVEPKRFAEGGFDSRDLCLIRVFSKEADVPGRLVGDNISESESDERSNDLLIGEPAAASVDGTQECEVALGGHRWRP